MSAVANGSSDASVNTEDLEYQLRESFMHVYRSNDCNMDTYYFLKQHRSTVLKLAFLNGACGQQDPYCWILLFLKILSPRAIEITLTAKEVEDIMRSANVHAMFELTQSDVRFAPRSIFADHKDKWIPIELLARTLPQAMYYWAYRANHYRYSDPDECLFYLRRAGQAKGTALAIVAETTHAQIVRLACPVDCSEEERIKRRQHITKEQKTYVDPYGLRWLVYNTASLITYEYKMRLADANDRIQRLEQENLELRMVKCGDGCNDQALPRDVRQVVSDYLSFSRKI